MRVISSNITRMYWARTGICRPSRRSIGTHDHLAVQLQHQPQHTVRRGMLRTEVEGVVPDFRHGSVRGSQVAILVLANDARRDLAGFDRYRLVDDALLLRVVTHLDVAREREILAERVADEAIIGEDAP